MARRASQGEGNASIHNLVNVFDDEFEVDDFDGIGDGFMSGHDREGGDGGHTEEDEPPMRSISAHYALTSVAPTATPSRNSTRKSRGADNPFSSPEDESRRSPLDRTPSIQSQSTANFAPGIAHRSVSSASNYHYARTNSPNLAVGGPSHPYGMYPQGTLPRSPSIATTSTIRAPQQGSSARDGPTHPYGMYPQGVGEEDDMEDDDPEPNPVPVGFPGLGQSYQRRIGPEGEEQDIVGEDGHTEQLPPYSRYPEEGAPKIPLLPPPLHSRGPVAGTDPGMPLMHEQSVPQSMTDASNLRRGSEPLRLEQMDSSTDSAGSKKSWSEKSWKEKRKTRFCGIPFWWILLAVCVLAFITIVLAGAIGGILHSQREHSKKNAVVTVYTSSLLDASPIATPPYASIPQGTFALDLGQPQETQAACLPQASQQPAWDCNFAASGGQGAEMALIVGPANGAGPNGASVFYASDDNVINYGMQTPDTSFSSFLTVQDNDDTSAGPAFYFQQTYDKIVVVNGSAFPNPNSSKNKRHHFEVPQAWQNIKQVVPVGDQPWFCIWNNTFLEGFIYVQEPIHTNSSSSAPTAAPVSDSYPSASSAISSTAPSYAAATSPSSTTGNSSPPPTSDFAQTTTTPSPYTSPSSSFDWDSARNSYTSAPGSRRRDADDLFNRLQQYPYIVKIEERRVSPNPVTPYCQLMQVLNDGTAGLVTDPSGQAITFELDEQDPSYGAYQSAGVAGKRTKRMIPGGCHCQWMSGQNGYQ